MFAKNMLLQPSTGTQIRSAINSHSSDYQLPISPILNILNQLKKNYDIYILFERNTPKFQLSVHLPTSLDVHLL